MRIKRLIQASPKYSGCGKVTGEDYFIAHLQVRSMEKLDELPDRINGYTEINIAIVKTSVVADGGRLGVLGSYVGGGTENGQKRTVTPINKSVPFSDQYPNLPPESEDKKFMVVARDEVGDYIGAISCNCYWDGLEIDTFWVKESHRGRKIGSMLLENAETIGVKNGAVVAFLKSIDAKQFYEQHGYEIYGVLGSTNRD